MIKIAFDVGGVISKYPGVFRRLWHVLEMAERCELDVEAHVISDMHPESAIRDMLARNGIYPRPGRVHPADYTTHGEACKAVLCEELGMDVLVDDFMGYVAMPGKPPVRLLVMPDPSLDYYHPSWQTDGSEGNFGRRRKAICPSCGKTVETLHDGVCEECDRALPLDEAGP